MGSWRGFGYGFLGVGGALLSVLVVFAWFAFLGSFFKRIDGFFFFFFFRLL